jgi:hypothetical protein
MNGGTFLFAHGCNPSDRRWTLCYYITGRLGGGWLRKVSESFGRFLLSGAVLSLVEPNKSLCLAERLAVAGNDFTLDPSLGELQRCLG